MRYPPSGCEPLDHAALMAQAKQRARTLRREAVPAFWGSLDARCVQAARSLTRFLHRLARYQQLRDQARTNALNVKEG
jgi:hypothetical protein